MDHFVTIFDAGNFQWSDWSFLIVPFVTFGGVMLIVLTVRKQKNDNFVNEGADDSGAQASRWGIVGIFVAGVVVFTGVMTVGNIWGMVTARDAFNRHQYQEVSGRVEQFHPMVFMGRTPESFVVGGVKFSYSDLARTIAFHHVAKTGGPVRNGDYVRIDYRCQAGSEVGDMGCYDPLMIRVEMLTGG